MLSVTVMIFRDMVESVMLLKEEACGAAPGEGLRVRPRLGPTCPLGPTPTRSVCRRRCFRRRRLCFRMSREEVLCSVELLSLEGLGVGAESGPGHPLPQAAGETEARGRGWGQTWGKPPPQDSEPPAGTLPTRTCTRTHARAPAHTPRPASRPRPRPPAGVVVLLRVDEAAGLKFTAQHGGRAVGGQPQVPPPVPPRVPVGPGGCGDSREGGWPWGPLEVTGGPAASSTC